MFLEGRSIFWTLSGVGNVCASMRPIHSNSRTKLEKREISRCNLFFLSQSGILNILARHSGWSQAVVTMSNSKRQREHHRRCLSTGARDVGHPGGGPIGESVRVCIYQSIQANLSTETILNNSLTICPTIILPEDILQHVQTSSPAGRFVPSGKFSRLVLINLF